MTNQTRPAIDCSANMGAFLYTIARSELPQPLVDCPAKGYNVVVGSTAKSPILFSDYSDHPRKLIDLPRLGIKSTAAGRYQIMQRYYEAYKISLKLPDFSPKSQDLIALQLIKECKAVQDIEEGKINSAIAKCRSRWASLPGAGYGQHENQISALLTIYQGAGGALND